MPPMNGDPANPRNAATPDPLLPRAALDAAIDAARLADPLVELPQEGGLPRQFLILPKGFEAKDVTDPDRMGAFIRETITFDDKASLTSYLHHQRLPNSMLVADIDAGKITAFIDWHMPNLNVGAHQPGPCQHRAILALRVSEEFKRWDAFEGEMHSQAEFAAFLEENASDVTLPEAATMLEVARDLEATQGVVFKSSNRLESGDRAFTYESETRTKGDVKVPREFVLNIPIFFGEEADTLRAALRFRVTPGGLLLGFEWRRVEYQRQARFRQIAYAIAEATGCPAYFGRRGG